MYILKLLVWQLVLDGVVDINVGYELNDSGSKHPSSVYLFYFILHNKVGIMLLFMWFYWKKQSSFSRFYLMPTI